jgi:hypothetical protein
LTIIEKFKDEQNHKIWANPCFLRKKHYF